MTLQHLPQPPSLLTAQAFAALASQWRAETSHLSDDTAAAANPNYRALVALGWRVVPFMLEEIAAPNPEHCFLALEEITGENPIPPEHRGQITRAAADWLAWGKAHGYRP